MSATAVAVTLLAAALLTTAAGWGLRGNRPVAVLLLALGAAAVLPLELAARSDLGEGARAAFVLSGGR